MVNHYPLPQSLSYQLLAPFDRSLAGDVCVYQGRPKISFLSPLLFSKFPTSHFTLESRNPGPAGAKQHRPLECQSRGNDIRIIPIDSVGLCLRVSARILVQFTQLPAKGLWERPKSRDTLIPHKRNLFRPARPPEMAGHAGIDRHDQRGFIQSYAYRTLFYTIDCSFGVDISFTSS